MRDALEENVRLQAAKLDKALDKRDKERDLRQATEQHNEQLVKALTDAGVPVPPAPAALSALEGAVASAMTPMPVPARPLAAAAAAAVSSYQVEEPAEQVYAVAVRGRGGSEGVAYASEDTGVRFNLNHFVKLCSSRGLSLFLLSF